MRTSATVAALIMLASVSQLSAQSGSSSGSSNIQTVKPPVGAGEKIPAHQQPKAADVQGATPNGGYMDKLSAEDQALDKKLRGICRGC
jgi:hypothetical protein